jgi:hypothetical protein
LKQISYDVQDDELVLTIQKRINFEENRLNYGKTNLEESDIHSQNIQVKVKNPEDAKTEAGTYTSIVSSQSSGTLINNTFKSD